jgi:hypothetical protein
MPSVIFPEIRVITADKITQNKTFYAAESLRKGLGSFVRPYPIPVIKDHDTSDNSNVYGRIAKKPQLISEGNVSYIRAIATITHQEAIEAVMSGRWLTVSLGSRTESVHCSICETELTKEWCEHIRGEQYDVGKKKQMAYWKIGPITAKEVSFVINPSDNEAGVTNANTQTEAARGGRQECGAGAVTRVIVGNEKGLFDLVTGSLIRESAFLPSQSPAAQCGNFQFLGF